MKTIIVDLLRGKKMTKFKDQIRKPTSCYTCRFNGIINEDQEDEWWACDEYNGMPVGTNPPYDEPCKCYQGIPHVERKEP